MRPRNPNTKSTGLPGIEPRPSGRPSRSVHTVSQPTEPPRQARFRVPSVNVLHITQVIYMQDGPAYNLSGYTQDNPVYNAFRHFYYLQGNPAYNPSGYTKDSPAYNAFWCFHYLQGNPAYSPFVVIRCLKNFSEFWTEQTNISHSCLMHYLIISSFSLFYYVIYVYILSLSVYFTHALSLLLFCMWLLCC